jgi:hypothetical protein
MNLTMSNSDQYLAIVGVMFLDGVFGMIAGCKREGFQTRKAIKRTKKHRCVVSNFNSYSNG